jgi:hypothetical protein
VVFATDKTWPCAPLIDEADEMGMEEILKISTNASNFLMAKL